MIDTHQDVQVAWTKAFYALLVTLTFFLIITFDVIILYQFIVALFLLISSTLFIGYIILALRVSIRRKQLPSQVLIYLIIITVSTASLIYMYRQGFFYGQKIIDATFLDDRSRIDLLMFSDGHYIINSNWLFGSETFTGTYIKNGNTITFDRYPVIDNDFIAKSIHVKGTRIYFRNNDIDTSFYYFKINN